MRDADIDLARLQARKDAAIARSQVRAHVWHGLQAAALASFGVAAAGFAQRSLTLDQAGWLTTVGLVALVLSAILLARQEVVLREDLEAVDVEMERLKSRGFP